MGTSDIDAAVEREMRRQAETEHVPYPDDLSGESPDSVERECEPRSHDPATGSYGDRAECAVCGVPLDRPPEPDGLLFCERHDRDDLRAQERHADERRREALADRHASRQESRSRSPNDSEALEQRYSERQS